MIDPHNLPDTWFQDELEEFVLFAIAVAGHNAKFTTGALDRLLKSCGWPDVYDTPFAAIQWTSKPTWESYEHRRSYLAQAMKRAGMGCHTARSESFMQIAHSDINLRTCTIDELEKIRGIGPKTSRFFIMYTRPEEADNYAVLDRHILEWMYDEFAMPIPMTTPQSTKRYQELETLFKQAARKRGLTARELDASIWQAQARR
jgi:hypothetical protein